MSTVSYLVALMLALHVPNGIISQAAQEEKPTPKNVDELILACAGGRSADALRLLREGHPVTARADHGETALYFAAASDKDEMIPVVEELLLRGAEVNCRSQDGFTPLHQACCSGRYEIVQVLLKHGADVSAAEKNHADQPFHVLAASAGDRHRFPSDAFRIAIELIAHKADLNAKDKEGKTPLACARDAERKDARLISLLTAMTNLEAKKSPQK